MGSAKAKALPGETTMQLAHVTVSDETLRILHQLIQVPNQEVVRVQNPKTMRIKNPKTRTIANPEIRIIKV